MSLERLIEEIRSRAEADLAEAGRALEAEKQRIVQDRDARAEAHRVRLRAEGEVESTRLHTQRIAGARMQARKLEYEAREKSLERSLDAVRDLLGRFTTTDEYPKVLERMYAFAADQLGKDVRISGRAEDASALKGLAGKSFVATPQSILGGLIAESSDGARRLTLSLDELLRLREDRVRELLA